jgi:SAM-dependent methyltransferase
MLSIEEIKLLKEKLQKLKGTDWEKFLGEQIELLENIEKSVDATNQVEIDRLDKTMDWFRRDLEHKKTYPCVPESLYDMVREKIGQFSKTNAYKSLEIGPGFGTFSKEMRQWAANYFLDILPELEEKVRRRFPPPHQKYLTFFLTKQTDCSNIPQGSCNFVFSWDTFVFFTQKHIQQYLHDIMRVLIPGGYVFIQYTDCHFDHDLKEAKRGYWNYNTKTSMEKIIKDEGYEVIEMSQFRPGANFAIFKKPGNENPAIYKTNEITLD